MTTTMLTEKEDTQRKEEEQKQKKGKKPTNGKSQQADMKTCISEDTSGETKHAHQDNKQRR